MKLRLALAALLAAAASPVMAEGFLRADGTRIVDGSGAPVILRGMGLGGWMLQEGYMLQLGDLGAGQQHVIRARIAELIGEDKTRAFYQAWLDHHTTEADVAAMAKAGFNSVRLPMHWNLLMTPEGAWREDGFRRIDDLLAWCARHRLYLILDLHAAPGGQGTDLPIADRDPATPSLWQSAENRRRTAAIWSRLAARYKDQPWIGGYDLLNEPNWDFDGEGGGHGCKDTVQAPLRALYGELIAAVRAQDKRHLIVVEGNCWGNNYAGLLPPQDGNLALSFHKYWNRNDAGSIAAIVTLRDRYKVPVWLGESGENSNVWFRDAIALVERQGIGWAFWPWKKIGFNQPVEILPGPGWARLVAYWTKGGPRPSAAEAEATLMRLATRDVRFENNLIHRDVLDAMLRQPHDPTPRPFATHRVGVPIAAVAYDLGPAGVAYSDQVDATYHVATGGTRVEWNTGRTYRNDGVDIRREPDGRPVVTAFETGEWMRYSMPLAPGRYAVTVEARAAGGGMLGASVGGNRVQGTLPAGQAWRRVSLAPLDVETAAGGLRLEAVRCGGCEVRGLVVRRISGSQ